MKKKLFEQFPTVSTGEWMEKINADLKGADFRKLIWKTAGGIAIKPFYREEDLNSLIAVESLPGEFPYRRGSKQGKNEWRVRQDIRVVNYAEANLKSLDILMKGIDSLGYIIDDPSTVTPENFKILLSGLQPEAVELNFLSNGKAIEILDIVTSVCRERGIDPVLLKGAIEADPLGRLMLNGTLCITPEEGFDYLAKLTRNALPLPDFRTIHIKASAFTNSGSDLVQELAFAVSMGTEYMTQLTSHGITGEEAASKIRFSFGIGPDYFPEIAKLRAARLLWSAIMKKFCSNSYPEMEMHCVTSGWNKTVYDPYVNMLRTQTEAMSAILGGTGSLTIEPFDSAYRESSPFSERIARNQQLILKEESGFDMVADPSAGSYYIENLTDMLADSAWKLFLETEEQGGFLNALRNGSIQKKIKESGALRKKEIASRKTILLGTNQYPDSGEKLSDKPDRLVLEVKAKSGTDVEPVLPARGAAEYEKIRMAVEASVKKPHVFLLTIGNPVMRKARAQFSSVFFGCGGYKVTNNNGFDTIEAGVRAAVDSKADIVVICSSDEEYASFAPEIYNNLKNKCIVVVAGNPACAEYLVRAGIEHFIHLKTDVPEKLSHFNTKMGMKILESVPHAPCQT